MATVDEPVRDAALRATGELTPEFARKKFQKAEYDPNMYDDNISPDYQFKDYVLGPFAGPPETVGGLRDRLSGIVREELAQVVSERTTTIDDVRTNVVRAAAGPRAKYGRMMPKAEFDALEAAAAAPDLSTSEPAMPDEQYPTSTPPTPLAGTPEQNAYARKLFSIPEPAAPAAASAPTAPRMATI